MIDGTEKYEALEKEGVLKDDVTPTFRINDITPNPRPKDFRRRA